MPTFPITGCVLYIICVMQYPHDIVIIDHRIPGSMGGCFVLCHVTVMTLTVPPVLYYFIDITSLFK